MRRWIVGDATVDEVRSAAYAAYAAAYAATAAATADAAADAADAAAAYAAAAADAADAYGKRREELTWQGERLLAYLRGDVAIPTREAKS
ncbi:MAG: hypothetical protein AB7R89_28265 [Dehalococcoidia bacterium]